MMPNTAPKNPPTPRWTAPAKTSGSLGTSAACPAARSGVARTAISRRGAETARWRQATAAIAANSPMTAAATNPASTPGTTARSMASPRDTLRTSAIGSPRRLTPGVIAVPAQAQPAPQAPPAHRPPAPGAPSQLLRLLLAEQAVGEVVLVLLLDGAAA